MISASAKKSTWHSCFLTRVIPPGYRYASNIKNDKAIQRCIGSTGNTDRRAVTLGDKKSAISGNC